MRRVEPGRRQQILEALASELEGHPGARITTAQLARVVGVSEAALYRHFASKSKMFESLIEFAEDSVFGLSNRILGEESHSGRRCERILTVMLTFSERNPGITRVLLGEALMGENERLRARTTQFFNRVETQLKQILREGEHRGEVSVPLSTSSIANLLVAVVEGRMSQYSRSGFQRQPTDGWVQQWNLLASALFATPT